MNLSHAIQVCFQNNPWRLLPIRIRICKSFTNCIWTKTKNDTLLGIRKLTLVINNCASCHFLLLILNYKKRHVNIGYHGGFGNYLYSLDKSKYDLFWNKNPCTINSTNHLLELQYFIHNAIHVTPQSWLKWHTHSSLYTYVGEQKEETLSMSWHCPFQFPRSLPELKNEVDFL